MFDLPHQDLRMLFAGKKPMYMVNIKDISHLPAVTEGRKMEGRVANYYKCTITAMNVQGLKYTVQD